MRQVSNMHLPCCQFLQCTGSPAQAGLPGQHIDSETQTAQTTAGQQALTAVVLCMANSTHACHSSLPALFDDLLQPPGVRGNQGPVQARVGLESSEGL